MLVETVTLSHGTHKALIYHSHLIWKKLVDINELYDINVIDIQDTLNKQKYKKIYIILPELLFSNNHKDIK